jgi:phosphoribosylanthranilate isomerase
LVQVKICGFTRAQDVCAACELGVDMVGVIVGVPTSPRNLSIERAGGVFRGVGGRVERVVVTTPGLALEISSKLEPDYVQIHGYRSPDELERIRDECGIKLIGVVTISPSSPDVRCAIQLALRVCEVADLLLLDTEGPAGGGTGRPHDWRVSGTVARAATRPVFLAGGLNPMNVAEAIRRVRPHGVDVSSGVESGPGLKDVELMRTFVAAAKGAGG